MFSFLNIYRGATSKAKSWLAAILVAAFSLTGLVPAQAVDAPSITLANSGIQLTGTTIAGFDPADVLHLQLTVSPSENVASPTLNFTDVIEGVTYEEATSSGSVTIVLGGTQAALNSAFASVTLGQLGEATTVSANITIPAAADPLASAASDTKVFSPTVVSVGAPENLLASPGQSLFQVDLSFGRGVNFVDGQLFTLVITQNGQPFGDPVDLAPGVHVFDSLPTDAPATFTLTAKTWVDSANGISLVGGASASVSSLSQGSGGELAATPVWTDSTLAPFRLNTAYSDGVSATSDMAITYVVTAGTLPVGLTLNSSTGAITGTPTVVGSNGNFTITAKTSPTWISLDLPTRVSDWRTCESYTNASYASNILLNLDGTPIGCDYESQPADLRPADWDTTFGNAFGANVSRNIQYSTRLGWACDDCAIGAGGVTTSGSGIPIGFDINFFGTTYSDIFINSNGSVSVGSGSSNYGVPLNEILDGAAGLVPYGVDLDNRDVTDAAQSWGTGQRHAEFFYWGRSTYEGKEAFVVTWMNSQIYRWGAKKDFSTFQVIIVNNGSGNADYIINYGSVQDANDEAGYDCPSGTCLAAGFGSNQNGSVLYASLQDETGYLYNGSKTMDAIDGGANALAQASLNSEIPGQFIFNMVDGFVPEVATIPAAPTNLAAINTDDSVSATWVAPLNTGGSPIGSFVLRYRLAGTTDAWTTTTSSTESKTITGLAAGDYVFQVAAVNEIGTGLFSRSLLLEVAGPFLANLTAYNEALAFVATLTQGYFTSETWDVLATALGTTVTTSNTQAEVDAQTAAINTAIAGLVVANVQVAQVDFTEYNSAVAYANGLRKATYSAETWATLVAELAVNVSAMSQAELDVQTAAINAAINGLALAGVGLTLAISDLTAYNAAVAATTTLHEPRFTPASWLVLRNALAVSITRDNSQATIDAQTLAITNAQAALVAQSNMVAYNLAVADASVLAEANYSPASWAALETALAVVVTAANSQLQVDTATNAINDAIAALVIYANVVAYNEAVANAATRVRREYTADSWAALTAALAIPVNRETDSQIYVDIATTNIVSALAALVAADGGALADLTAYIASRAVAAGKIEAGYTTESWAALQAALTANVVTDANTQGDVNAAVANIDAAITALVEVVPAPIAIYAPYVSETTAPVKKIVALSLQRMVKKVLKFNVPVLVGKALMSPVLFSGTSSQLNSNAIKALKEFAAKQQNLSGWLLVTGYVQFSGKNTANARKIAADRAKNVATMLLNLGVKAEIGYAGYGPANTNAPKATDRKAEIRWVAAL